MVNNWHLDWFATDPIRTYVHEGFFALIKCKWIAWFIFDCDTKKSEC